jgi:hypothetical protein
MDGPDIAGTRVTRRGLILGAVAAAGFAATGTPAEANPTRPTPYPWPPYGPPRVVPPSGQLFHYDVPSYYQTAVPGESLEVDRVDLPVAPGIVLTSFDTFGRQGWLRVHVLNADLGNASVGVDLLADKVSDPRVTSVAADSAHAVAAVNGDFFDITETFAAEGPEVQNGVLRKGTNQSSTVATVGADRVARLADLMLQGTITIGGNQRPLAALNSEIVPADGIDVFTPLWGGGLRTLIGAAGPYTELIVQNGAVSAINDKLTTTPVPDGGLIIIGRGAAATALAGAQLGDGVSVTYAPATDSPAPLRMALGSGVTLVKDGNPGEFGAQDGNKPRTVIGWREDGHRLLLVAVDGAARFSTGISYDDLAALMIRLGATDAFMLDGGGSTEMVARVAGDAGVSVTNTPSDGNERIVANGVGLFAAPGSGNLRGLAVRPGADRVVPGLTLDVAAVGYDETWAAVPLGSHPVDWVTTPGSLGRVSDGTFQAHQSGNGTLHAMSGTARGEYELRVVGPLNRLTFSEKAVTMDAGATVHIGLTGYDADGFGAPVAPRDATLGYDATVVTVAAADDGTLAITGGTDADGKATVLTATVQGITAKLAVTVGLATVPLAEFEPGETWTVATARATGSVAIVDNTDRPGAATGNHVLRLTYDFTGQPSTSATYAVAGPKPITLPSGAKKLALWVNGDGKGHWLRAMMASQGTTNVPFTFANVVDWTGWRRVVGDIPAGFTEPITLSRVYLVETSQTNKTGGVLEFDGLAAEVGQVPPNTGEAPRPDPYVLEQRTALEPGRWSFAVLSDLHVSAAQGVNSFSYRQAAKALDQAVAANPDFLLINGDFVDDDNPGDFVLANGLLSDHVPASVPVYWGPGNHEAGLTSTGGLDAFVAGTGRPTHQVFDHKGTRVVMLDSHTGDLRTSEWDQFPLLQSQLAAAATDGSVKSVVVSFHHPLIDPTGAGASQLSDPLEADLIQRWLTDFRETSGKPIALFTGHAHDASISRADGVLAVTTPAVGKTPYASPDQGGFFGWMQVGVDPSPARIVAGEPSPATRDWLAAEVRPLIDGVELTAPDQVAVGSSTTVTATGITSEFGLSFPLRFPATVVWSGDPGLSIVDSTADVKAAARKPGTLAVLDLSTGALTAARAGSVTVTVASGGLRQSATVTLTN